MNRIDCIKTLGRQWVTFCGVIICITGCSREVKVPEVITEAPLALHALVSASTSSHTRAAFVDTKFPVGTALGVGLIKNPGNKEVSPYNQSSVYILQPGASNVSETWTVNSGINGLFVSTVPALAIAYYPVSANNVLTMMEEQSYITPALLETCDMGNLTNYTIGGGVGVLFGDEVVKVSTQEVDYMVGKGNAAVTSATPRTTIDMKHALAMVSVRAIRDKSYFGGCAMTSFTIANSAEGGHPLKKGSIRLYNNQFFPGTADISYTRSFTGYYVDENSAYNDRVGFLAFPAVIQPGELSISLAIDGKTYQGATNTEQITFEAGKLTQLNITVSASEITLSSSIMVEDWIDTDENEFKVE